MAEYQQPQQSNTTRNVIIAVAVVLFLCCCCLVAIWSGLVLGGPTIGNVFSNIVEGLEMTPVP